MICTHIDERSAFGNALRQREQARGEPKPPQRFGDTG